MPILNPRRRPEIENLPPKYKWEVLRRHPHYIRDWRLATLYWATPPDSPIRNDKDWPDVEAAAVRMHQLTGWSDRDYPDPARGADELGGGFLERQAGEENAKTLTARHAIESIIWTVPPELLREVGRIFLGEGIESPQALVRCGTPDGRDVTHQYLQTKALTRITSPALDAEVPGHLVVNLDAPLRGISEQVVSIVKAEKGRRGLKEKRPRPDLVESYLQVWDVREGWSNGKYDGRQEKPLRLVAQQVQRHLRTVEAQYRQAFGLIVGTDYRPQEWHLKIGRHKWPWSKYKGWRNAKPRRQVKLVTWEGALTEAPSADDGPAQLELQDLVQKVQELGGDGVPPAEISRRLEIEVAFNVPAAEAEVIVRHLLNNGCGLGG
jgi:hypothetical protein